MVCAWLSANIARKDGRHPIIFLQCGSVRYRVDAKSQAATRPFSHKVTIRETGFRLAPDLERRSVEVEGEKVAGVVEQ